jgi:hypothetical protein
MNDDNDHSQGTGLQWHQFSLKALLLAVLCFSLAGAMATWQREAFAADRMKTPTWLFLCLFGWNAAIACQFAFSIWGWITLWRFAPPPGEDSLKHSRAGRDYLGLRRVYLGGVAWGVLSFFLWLSFAIIWLSDPSRAAEDEVAMAFCATVWHLVPWTIVSYIRFAARSKWRNLGPLAAMRLAAIVGVGGPATGFTVYLMLQMLQ